MSRTSRLPLALALIVTAVVAGCSFDRGGIDPSPVIADADPGAPDAISPPDADPLRPDADPLQPDATSVCSAWTPPPAHFDPCAIMPPGTSLVLDESAGTYEYDTLNGTLTDPGDTPVPHTHQLILVNNALVRIISASSVHIENGAVLRVKGPHPLLIASWSTIELSSGSSIRVNSVLGDLGAGANPSSCGAGAQPGVSAVNGGGGGGGGALAAAGGKGGNGDGGATSGGNPGSPASTPVGIRGGCTGGKGGLGDSGDGAGLGGPGGGALQLTALGSITIDGVLHAGGGGGGGAVAFPRYCGGGGGGSGGMLGLEALTITLTSNAVLAANGGGGGGGTGTQMASPGINGGPDASRPSGGAGQQSQGGAGGAGGYIAAPVGQPGLVENRGGGGGGGGAGYVLTRGQVDNQGAVISPGRTSL